MKREGGHLITIVLPLKFENAERIHITTTSVLVGLEENAAASQDNHDE